MDVCIGVSDDWLRFRPKDEPPSDEGLMPPLLHGTPTTTDVGSSGGVT